jgi:hypothetical protein
MPVFVTKIPWEVAAVVEQIYTIVFTEDLRPTLEDRRAASLEYAAEHRLTRTRLETVMRSSLLAMREVEEIARRLRLLQLYGRRCRPSTPDRKASPVPPPGRRAWSRRLGLPVQVFWTERDRDSGSVGPSISLKAVRDKTRCRRTFEIT